LYGFVHGSTHFRNVSRELLSLHRNSSDSLLNGAGLMDFGKKVTEVKCVIIDGEEPILE